LDHLANAHASATTDKWDTSEVSPVSEAPTTAAPLVVESSVFAIGDRAAPVGG
jgi:hypothetical protein